MTDMRNLPDRLMARAEVSNNASRFGEGADFENAAHAINSITRELAEARARLTTVENQNERLKECLGTISRTKFSGSEMGADYMRGNNDAHETCARMARAGLAPMVECQKCGAQVQFGSCCDQCDEPTDH